MGYYVEMSMDVIVKDEAGALEAINAMHEPEVVKANGSGGRWANGRQEEKWYSWVNNPGPEGFPTLEDALAEWRYVTERHGEEGVLSIVYFAGEKLGDDDQLFNAIGPYLEGEITCEGEDGELWGYRFKDGIVTEMTGEVVWTEM